MKTDYLSSVKSTAYGKGENGTLLCSSKFNNFGSSAKKRTGKIKWTLSAILNRY